MDQVPESPLTSEEEYRSIFEAATDGLIIYDMELDRVVEANSAACAMHGYSRQEFVGMNPESFMLPESYGEFREHVRAAGAGGAFESLVVHVRRDGSRFHVDVLTSGRVTRMT